MKTVVPDYYHDFKCIADKCSHSCCIGWEIDIDDNSLEKYLDESGYLGQKLRSSIATDEYPHFKLTRDERCPFLNSNNLCELILEKGEDFLCQICTDHPRFRNFIGDRMEMGLGLCCEEACQIILTCKEKVNLITISDEEEKLSAFEKLILNVRDKAFLIITDRSITIEERVQKLIREFNIAFPQKNYNQWYDFFLSLERLDHSWEKEIIKLKNKDDESSYLYQFEIPFEQLLVYFIYRHLPLSQGEIDIKAQLAYSILAYKIINKILSAYKDPTAKEFLELCRLYSSEIEYSEENTDKILELLWITNN